MVEVLARYGELYGSGGVLTAAFTLDKMLRESDFLADMMERQQLDEAEAMASVHRLHASGLLLVADDSSIWMSLPPGVPDPAETQWRRQGQIFAAPRILV